jgi:hypothetical protein
MNQTGNRAKADAITIYAHGLDESQALNNALTAGP